MKKIILLILTLSFSQTFAQVELSTGMGINYSANSSLKNYLNANFNAGNSVLSTFSAQVEFFGEGVYSVSYNFQLGIDYGLSVYSYNNTSSINYELSYNVHKPSIVAYYVIPGKGYKFKFGGGVGLRLVNLDERIFSTVNYSGTGFGFLARAEGHTSLGGNLYAMLAADMRYDLINNLSSENKLFSDNSGGEVNLNTFSVGVKIGISYHF